MRDYSENEVKPYDVVSHEAYRTMRSVVDGLVSEIQHGNLTDEDEIEEALHESVDSHLTCTHDQWICAWGLPDSEDFEGIAYAETFDSALAQKAYCNLRSAVQDNWAEIEQALSIKNDEREEKGES